MLGKSPTAAPIDPQILAIASLTDLPTQPITLTRGNGILGKQLNSVNSAQVAVPVVNNQAPINVSRLPAGTVGGVKQFTYRVQFFQPPANSPYQSTSILLRSAQGSTTVATSGKSGPLVYSGSRQVAPAAAVVQQTNADGATSGAGIGGNGGNSRALNVL